MEMHGFADFDKHYPSTKRRKKKADYFLARPRIIIEKKDVNTENVQSMSGMLERNLSKSNHQLQDARDYIKWDDAEGVLLLINQTGGSLPFEQSFETILRRLEEVRPNGQRRFSNIQALIYVHHAKGYALHLGRTCVCAVGSWGSPELNAVVRTIGDTWSQPQADWLRLKRITASLRRA